MRRGDIKDPDAHKEAERAIAEHEWFVARREQAIRDILLLMGRYEISFYDLAILTQDLRGGGRG